jgi:hypothetical protein
MIFTPQDKEEAPALEDFLDFTKANKKASSTRVQEAY